jgi:serine protease AprX
VELPNKVLRRLADHPSVQSIHHDRPTAGEMNRAASTVGARLAQAYYGYTGAGVGVAVIDSGITAWHDDLTHIGWNSSVRVVEGQRVSKFVDFVNDRTAPYDDNGHGTHVAGIIAGNGFDSLGARAGIAPSAHLVSLKVLDSDGAGVISDVIAALDWTVANRTAHNIRVVNLSVGAAVTESFHTDPLTLAARRVFDAGIVVVSAAGNLGRNPEGGPLYGGITAPGNAPWVLTVGASNQQGTVSRSDDVVAEYSSRGPTAVDFAAKPDIVAPGSGLVSLADPLSTIYRTRPDLLQSGLFPTSYKPYVRLSGTSMAAPVVSGTVALMIQANPSLTPNMVKAILQYTAERSDQYDPLTQGGGFVNTYEAVRLSRFFRHARPGDWLPIPSTWSREIIWGNRRITGGIIRPNANAFSRDTIWGAASDAGGRNIVWGTVYGRAENIVWGTFYGDARNIVWGTFDTLGASNIVWGTLVDSSGFNIVWGTYLADNIVWGTSLRNIVWGTSYLPEHNVVWGTDCDGADCDGVVWGSYRGQGDNIVWGTVFNEKNIVWGTALRNIVWGTALSGDNIVWGTVFNERNIVWGTAWSTSGDNIVWGTALQNIVWGTSSDDPEFDDPTDVMDVPFDLMSPDFDPIVPFTSAGDAGGF